LKDEMSMYLSSREEWTLFELAIRKRIKFIMSNSISEIIRIQKNDEIHLFKTIFYSIKTNSTS